MVVAPRHSVTDRIRAQFLEELEVRRPILDVLSGVTVSIRVRLNGRGEPLGTSILIEAKREPRLTNGREHA